MFFLQLYKMYSDNQYPPPPVDLIRVPAFLGMVCLESWWLYSQTPMSGHAC